MPGALVSVQGDAKRPGSTFIGGQATWSVLNSGYIPAPLYQFTDRVRAKTHPDQAVGECLDILKDAKEDLHVSALQLKYLKAQEDKLRKNVGGLLHSLHLNEWSERFTKAIRKPAGGKVDLEDPRLTKPSPKQQKHPTLF